MTIASYFNDKSRVMVTRGKSTYDTINGELHRITILTSNPLSDDQMKDIYALALLLNESGKRMKDIFENKEEIKKNKEDI